MVGPNEFNFQISGSHTGGSEAAVLAAVHGKYASGAQVTYDGVFIYTVGENRKIRSVRAFWDIDAVMNALGAKPADGS